MVLTTAEMRALEERAFAAGILAEALMEEAGWKIAAAVQQFCPSPGRCIVYFGKGHNGGDALVAARWLARSGWQIELEPAFPESGWAELTRRKHHELASGEPRLPQCSAHRVVVLDGLLGIGAGGALRSPIREATRAINHLRAHSAAKVFAIDLPTGLDGDTGAADPDAVVADYTLTIGCAKTGLLTDSAAHHVGRLAVLPLHELTVRPGPDSGPSVATPDSLATLLPRRPFDIHKGDCGRVGIIAGSAGMTGAAILCAEAAVHAGAGLVTLYVTPDIHPQIAPRIAPEVMVKSVASYLEVLAARHDLLALGPGLGRSNDREIIEIITRASLPLVLDADALNALSSQLHLLAEPAGPRLLAPHPGEMQRLAPDSSSTSRRETVEAFTDRFPITLLLKGARTLVGQRDRPLSYNSTGSPGMATGGMGDVLTGVCAALIAQGISVYDSARLGAWLCGRAAECAIVSGLQSEESLSARHVIEHLGPAFHQLRAGCY